MIYAITKGAILIHLINSDPLIGFVSGQAQNSGLFAARSPLDIFPTGESVRHVFFVDFDIRASIFSQGVGPAKARILIVEDHVFVGLCGQGTNKSKEASGEEVGA